MGGQEKDLFIINSGHAVLSHNVTGKASYRTGLAPFKHTKVCRHAFLLEARHCSVPDRLSPNDQNKPHMNPVFSACRGVRGKVTVLEELAPNLLTLLPKYVPTSLT